MKTIGNFMESVFQKYSESTGDSFGNAWEMYANSVETYGTDMLGTLGDA